MKQRYQIITIYEEDHGCEGIPEGEEPMRRALDKNCRCCFAEPELERRRLDSLGNRISNQKIPIQI